MRIASTKLNLDFFIRLLSLSIFGNFSSLCWFCKTPSATTRKLFYLQIGEEEEKIEVKLGCSTNEIHFNFTGTSQHIQFIHIHAVKWLCCLYINAHSFHTFCLCMSTVQRMPTKKLFNFHWMRSNSLRQTIITTCTPNQLRKITFTMPHETNDDDDDDEL